MNWTRSVHDVDATVSRTEGPVESAAVREVSFEKKDGENRSFRHTVKNSPSPGQHTTIPHLLEVEDEVKYVLLPRRPRQDERQLVLAPLAIPLLDPVGVAGGRRRRELHGVSCRPRGLVGCSGVWLQDCERTEVEPLPLPPETGQWKKI